MTLERRSRGSVRMRRLHREGRFPGRDGKDGRKGRVYDSAVFLVSSLPKRDRGRRDSPLPTQRTR